VGRCATRRLCDDVVEANVHIPERGGITKMSVLTSAETVPEDIARAVILSPSYGDLEGTVLPACAWLRDELPFGRAQVEGYDPVWLVTRHADIQTVLRDPDTFHSADINPMFHPIAGDAFTKSINNGTTRVLNFPTYMDPPEHAIYRNATAQAFQPAAVRRWSDRFREIAREQVDQLLEAGEECDFVRDLSRHYPLHTVMEMLGVPEADYELMLKLTQDTFGGEDPDWNRSDIPLTPEAAAKQWQAAVLDFERYFAGLLEDRQANPTDDLITTIVTARLPDGKPMPPLFQNHYVSGLAAAGHDTTNSAISGGMLGLARFPGQLEQIQAEPKLIAGLVEESLRYATPAKHFMRNATRDTEVAGVPVKAMDRLMCLFVSGNRDAAVFTDPDRFDVTRRPNPHLSFSFGPHVCLGQHVSKLEMRILFEELLPRLKSIELAGEPVWKVSNFVSGIKSLPLRLTPA
jgi:alpha-terpineol hydroxylase